MAVDRTPSAASPRAGRTSLRDHEGLEARVLNGTATKADVEWLVESLETVTAERDDLREKLAEQRSVCRAWHDA